jgi:TM2 domain-containing membrane protein YozV
MTAITTVLPELDPMEASLLQSTIVNLDKEQAEAFAASYRAQRKDAQTVMLTSLLGLVLIGGVQRFVLGQMGMGLLYFFTGGLCGVGTIIDLINHKRLALEYNQRIAQQIHASLY